MSGGAIGDHRAHMDGIYRHQRYFYDVSRKYFLLGRDRLIADLGPPPGGSVLEFGCGTGRNLILTAQRYPHAQCYGFDLSGEMLKTARVSIARAGLSARVVLAQGDATAFDPEALFGCRTFDRVFISYALSMIPAWREVLSPALGSVAPGGRLHIVDFGQQQGLPPLFKRVLFAWLAKFTVEPRAGLETALLEAAAARGVSVEFDRLFRGYADYAVVRRS